MNPPVVCAPDIQKSPATLSTCVGNDRQSLWGINGSNDMRCLLDDPRLLDGDRSQRLSQIRLMLQGDIGDHRYLGVENVCRIEPASHPYFYHRVVHLTANEVEEGEGGRDLEEGGVGDHGGGRRREAGGR